MKKVLPPPPRLRRTGELRAESSVEVSQTHNPVNLVILSKKHDVPSRSASFLMGMNEMNEKNARRNSDAGGASPCGIARASSRSGQAMIEFVICLVGILVAAAGLLLLADLTRSDTDTLVAATGEAISASMSLSIPSSFSPVEDWDEGADGMRHTKDDRARSGNFSRIRNRITVYTAPDGDWSGTRHRDGSSAHYDDIVQFNEGVLTASTLRFVSSSEEETVTTLPVLQSLLGLPSEITVRNEVWMPSVGGLY